MKSYGTSTEANGASSVTTPPRHGSSSNEDRSPNTSYLTPYQDRGSDRPAMPRNESAGGATAQTNQTNETEPLLGEQLLSGNDDEDGEDPKWISPVADASTIEKVESDNEMDTTPDDHNARTPPRAGSVGKRIPRPESDPRIGINVITNELDTLAYSRDPDESTLLTNDNFTKKYLSSLDEEGNRKGMLRRLFEKSEGAEPPYVLVCLGLAVGVALCSIAALAYVQYNHHQTKALPSDVTSSSSEGTWHGVPYTQISRESFGDPVSNIVDVRLFHPSLFYGGHAPKSTASTKSTRANKQHAQSSVDDDRNRKLAGAPPKPFLRYPFPTGAFWTNLVLLPQNKQLGQHPSSSTQENPNQFSYPIVAYPYSYQWSSVGKLQASYSAARRVIKAKSIQDAFAPDITVGSKEAIQTRHVVKFDSLSVTLRFSPGNSRKDGGSWETYIVQGSPYITAKFSGLSPQLRALSDFTDIACPPTFQAETPNQKQPKEESNQQRRRVQSPPASTTNTPTKKLGTCGETKLSSKQKKIITGVQFVVTTKEQLTWLVFASEPITLEFDQAARRVIQSKEQYGGVIRLALVPPPSLPASSTSTSGATNAAKSLDMEHLASSPGVKRLIYHAGAYPVGGEVSWDFISGARHPLTSSTSSKNHGHRKASEQVRRHRQMAAEAPKEHNIGKITFAFDTVHWTSSSPNTNVPLLMLSLPHHSASISSADKLLLSQDDFDLAYQSIKGRMVPVVGNTWSYEEDLTFIGFGDETLPAKANVAQTLSTTSTSTTSIIHESTAISTLDQSIRDMILQTVESDLKINLPVLTNGAYGFGKQIARLAQLAHIAEVVDAANVRMVDVSVDRIKNTKNSSKTNLTSSESTSVPSNGSGTARRAYALLEKYLEMWFHSGSEKRLVYDAQLGGILSTEGIENINADFGNARYNDHHFHYGYVLYASAILGRANPKFISQYGPFVDALFYDVAHNKPYSKLNNGHEIFFPLARHKSWFDGHSFASGLFPFADGKSQESSSEAVNCYYGAYLWSRVRWGGSTDRRMVDFTRLLLATEMTGAETYWHMTPPRRSHGSGNTNNTIPASAEGTSLLPVAYTPDFRKNYMVGNLGMTDVTCTTWFGTEQIYVHLINFMPVTAITAELFDKGKSHPFLRSYTCLFVMHFICPLSISTACL